MKRITIPTGSHIEFFPVDPADKLPEYCTYKDEGCRLSKSCLSCPLPACIEDNPENWKTSVADLRGKEIYRVYIEKKLTVQELSVKFKVTRPTVYAALKKNKEQ